MQAQGSVWSLEKAGRCLPVNTKHFGAKSLWRRSSFFSWENWNLEKLRKSCRITWRANGSAKGTAHVLELLTTAVALSVDGFTFLSYLNYNENNKNFWTVPKGIWWKMSYSTSTLKSHLLRINIINSLFNLTWKMWLNTCTYPHRHHINGSHIHCSAPCFCLNCHRSWRSLHICTTDNQFLFRSVRE